MMATKRLPLRMDGRLIISGACSFVSTTACPQASKATDAAGDGLSVLALSRSRYSSRRRNKRKEPVQPRQGLASHAVLPAGGLPGVPHDGVTGVLGNLGDP
jgi:hypothetical protein